VFDGFIERKREARFPSPTIKERRDRHPPSAEHRTMQEIHIDLQSVLLALLSAIVILALIAVLLWIAVERLTG
jgi:hypothetical protein